MENYIANYEKIRFFCNIPTLCSLKNSTMAPSCIVQTTVTVTQLNFILLRCPILCNEQYILNIFTVASYTVPKSHESGVQQFYLQERHSFTSRSWPFLQKCWIRTRNFHTFQINNVYLQNSQFPQPSGIFCWLVRIHADKSLTNYTYVKFIILKNNVWEGLILYVTVTLQLIFTVLLFLHHTIV